MDYAARLFLAATAAGLVTRVLEAVKGVCTTWSFRVQRGISHATHGVICGIPHWVRNDRADALSDFFHSFSESPGGQGGNRGTSDTPWFFKVATGAVSLA